MLRNRLYYLVKPMLPLGVRLGIRRWMARRTREHVSDVWPIKPGSEIPPAGWPGWPGGKKFAFVLTHDVEGIDGMAKCRQLMKLETDLGFHSSFNFIPEGPYRVPQELRDEVARRGFEVGVHDLRHDGKLFRSFDFFRRNAGRINQHLADWGAAGFRSGFMLHQPGWLHELDICYDASTFDTDPFEPQPEGRGTIFPFWVPNPRNPELDTRNSEPGTRNPKAGYVELPYTLPQDSTLFLILGETTPEIWLRKLDWVARHGGMALVNVHPDYLQFEGERPSKTTYSVNCFLQLLQHIRQRYGDTFWQPLPGEAARFVAGLHTPPVRRAPRRVCMVTHSFYESDNRVTRYAEALAARGDHVDVLALRRTPGLPVRETIAGVNVFRIQSRFGKKERSRLDYLLPLVRFLVSSSIWITRRHFRERYDLFHIHNVPDFLVFSAWYPKWTGARIILDIHDITPEFYVSKFRHGPNGLIVALLRWMERVSAWFAHRIIIANHLWLDVYAARTRSQGKTSVLINNVDSRIFHPRPRTRQDGKLIMMFPGGLQWHQGLDIAIRAFHQVSPKFPNAEFHVYGDGNMKESLVTLAQDLGLNGKVRFFDPLPVRQVAEVMANADFGVVPKRADSFGNEAYSTKIMEFMSVGVPVVVSSTRIDRYYFDDSVVQFFESGNSDALAHAIEKVLTDVKFRKCMVARALEYAERNNWESCKADYLETVNQLCETPSKKLKAES